MTIEPVGSIEVHLKRTESISVLPSWCVLISSGHDEPTRLHSPVLVARFLSAARHTPMTHAAASGGKVMTFSFRPEVAAPFPGALPCIQSQAPRPSS